MTANHTDTRLLDLERELLALDRMIAAAEEAHDDATLDSTFKRRTAVATAIFKKKPAGLEGLRVQARLYILEHARDLGDADENPLDFSRIGRVLAAGVARLEAQ